MPLPQLCTEAEVAELVATFYAKVRDDAILGPVFERHVADWQSIWYDYQLQREPDRMPASLPRRAATPRSVPVPE